MWFRLGLGWSTVALPAIANNCIDPHAQSLLKQMPPEVRARLTAAIPMGREGQVDDIAAAVAFLASDDAQYITAQNIQVNGGLRTT